MLNHFGSLIENAKKVIGKGGSFASRQGKAANSLVILIMTTLLNKLATKEFFKCPGEGEHERAGWSFMFVPGVVLGIVLLMSSDRISHGSILYGRKKGTTARFYYRAVSLSLAYSTLAFLSWVIASLLFTETYACTKLGPVPETKNQTKIDMYNSKKAVKNTESKVLGLYVLLIALVVQLGLFFIHKCCLSDLSEIPNRLKSMDSYDKLEAEGAKAKFESLVEEHGKANGEREMTNLTKSIRPADSDSAPLGDQTGGGNESKKELWSREQIEKLRQKLTRIYPRLDNPLDRTLPFKKLKFRRDNPHGDAEDGKIQRSHYKATEWKRHLPDSDVEEVIPILQSPH